MKIVQCKLVSPRLIKPGAKKYACRKTRYPGVSTYTYLSSGIQLSLKLTEREILWITSPSTMGYYPKFEKHLERAFDVFLTRIQKVE